MKYLTTRSDDGTQLRLARWNEAGEKDLLLIHGFSEHIGRYHHIASFFAEQGWRVTALEFRGHGHSEGRKGHVHLWMHYCEDLQAAMGTIGRPLAIVAHSMGGLITLWSMMFPLTPMLRCVALSNPLLGLVEQPSKRLMLIGQIAARIRPTLMISRESKPEYLSRDPKVVQAFKDDPLICSDVSARWASQMLEAIRRVHAYGSQYRYPLRLMLGGQDKVCDPMLAQRFAASYGGSIDLMMYQQCYHELFNEPEKYEILAATEEWLDHHFHS